MDSGELFGGIGGQGRMELGAGGVEQFGQGMRKAVARITVWYPLCQAEVLKPLLAK